MSTDEFIQKIAGYGGKFNRRTNCFTSNNGVHEIFVDLSKIEEGVVGISNDSIQEFMTEPVMKVQRFFNFMDEYRVHMN